MKPENSELGKKSSYDTNYNPERLYAIPRLGKREEIGIDSKNLPFYGFDCWNHYEVSWLNPKGKPMVAIAEIYYDCTSPNIIESKSLKLYFNSFNNFKATSKAELCNIIKQDLDKQLETDVTVNLYTLAEFNKNKLHITLNGESIDDLDISCDNYLVHPEYLTTNAKQVSEELCSDLLKSNCLVTGQPDWGSISIVYTGNKIDREGLLKYIVSFRNHNEFHEQCIERIFNDIMQYCKPSKLTIYGRYTRRGGLDINPYRSTEQVDINDKNLRLVRQ